MPFGMGINCWRLIQIDKRQTGIGMDHRQSAHRASQHKIWTETQTSHCHNQPHNLTSTMPTEPTVKQSNGHYRLLGFRILIEPIENKSLSDSWLWTPEGSRREVKTARVIQRGKYARTERRTEMEVELGDTILFDTSKGSVDIVDGDRKFKVISFHDCLAVLS